jgi:DNA polymerase-3 subunit delta'
MPFSELKTQDRAVSSLRSALRRGAVHHAYLFAGPEGAGKGRAALLLAQAANCEGGPDEQASGRDDPCGACGPCRKIERGVHPDVLVLRDERAMTKAGRWEPKGGRTPSKDIVVDQVRDVVDRRLALKRFEGRRRFVIVDPADAMNPQAQNALLKTLEEPPPDTTLVLVASSPDSLLPTIRSRCLRVPFAPLPAAPMAEEERAAVVAAAGLDRGDAASWLAFAAEHGKERERVGRLCDLLALWLRDVLAVQAGGAPRAIPELEVETRRAADALAPAEVLRRRAEVQRTAAAVGQNAAPVLAVERMLIEWFHGRG